MIRKRITFEQLEQAIESDDSAGFCLACGAASQWQNYGEDCR